MANGKDGRVRVRRSEKRSEGGEQSTEGVGSRTSIMED